MRPFPRFLLFVSMGLFAASCQEEVKVKVVDNPGAPESFAIQSEGGALARLDYVLRWSSLETNNPSYTVLVSPQKDCAGSAAVQKETSATELAIDFLSDGQYYFCIFGRTKSQRLAASNNGLALTIDLTPPTVTASDSLWRARELMYPTLTAEDLHDVTVTWSQQSGPGTLRFTDTKAISPGISADADGLYTLQAIFSDSAGNELKKTYSFEWDTTPPLLTLPADTTTTAPLVLTAQGDASIVGLNWTFIAENSNGTISFSDSHSLSPSVTASGVGIYRLTLTAADALGNSRSATMRLTWNPMPLAYVGISLSGPAADGIVTLPERGSATDLVGNLVSTGQTEVQYKLVSAASTCNSSLSYTTAIPNGTSSDFAADGSYKVCLRLQDYAGVFVYESSASFILDVSPAVFTSTSLANAASDGFINAAEHALAQDLVSGLVSSDAATIAYALVLDGTSCAGPLTYASSIPRSDDSRFTSSGAYRVCVRLQDASLNPFVYGQSAEIQFDDQAPIINSFSRQAEASDGFIILSEATATQALWALNSTGATSTAFSTYLNDSSGSQVCDGSVVYNQGSSVPSAVNLVSDGTWTLCVSLADAAGNITYGKGPSVVRDIVPPVLTSFLAANEAADGYINSSESNATGPLYTLVASGYSTIGYTAVQNNLPLLTCNSSQTYDQTSIPTIASLTVDQPSAICVRLADAAGNLVYGRSENVTRHALGPGFGALTPAAEGSDGYVNDSEKAATTALWTLSAQDATVIAYSAAIADSAGTQVCDGSVSYNQGTSVPRAVDLASDGIWTVCVKLSDSGGSLAYGKAEPIVRDTAHPTFTTLALANAATDAYINDSEKLLVSALWILTGSGYATASYTAPLADSAGTASCTGKTYSQSSIPTPASLASDDIWVSCVQLVDAAGNITLGKSVALTRDVVAPVLTSLNGANGASDLYIKSSEASSNAALYTLVASGHSAEAYTVAGSDSPTALTCDSGANYNQSSIPLISSLSIDGTYAVCVRLSDAAGNATYGKSQQVTRDIVAPVFTSLNRANEASDGVIFNAEKTSTSSAFTLSATGYSGAAYTAAVDDSGGAVCDGSQNYSGSSIPRIVDFTADGTWAVCVQLSDSAGNTAFGKSQQLIRDTVTPGAPANFTAAAGQQFLDLNWDPSTGSPAGYLLVRGAAGSAPSFAPVAGQTYTAGTQGSDQIVYLGPKTAKYESGLILGTSYTYKVYAYSTTKNYSAASSVSATPVTPCPTGYVSVNGDADYSTKDFCVMKYEAKDVGGYAGSVATGVPWATLDLYKAQTSCEANGPSYHLMNNPEWMSVASHVASLGANWSGGAVGSGVLSKGHSDNDPNTMCAASSDDTLSWVEGTCTPIGTGGGENEEAARRRTNVLADGEVIWDLAGNAWEWTDYVNSVDMLSPTPTNVELNSLISTEKMPVAMIFPTHAIKSYWNDSWNSSQNIGQYYGDTNGNGAALKRGGVFNEGTASGLFRSLTSQLPVTNGTTTAFRCVQRFADPDPSNFAITAGDSQLTASWTAVGGAAGYLLVRGPTGSRPTFVPQDGVSYGAGSQGSDQIVYDGTNTSYTNTGLDNGREYHYELLSYDASLIYSSLSRTKDSPIACPDGFVMVPGDKDYAIDDFCVMKYEAKAIGNIVASKPQGYPWTNIAMRTASAQCPTITMDYHMMNNMEWMTLTSNIASRGTNWSGGTVGSGALYVGHADSNPDMSCEASRDDARAFVENNCLARASGDGENNESIYRRTTSLSTGAVIWDLSGNAAEMISYYNLDNKPYLSTDLGPVNANREFTVLDSGLTTLAKRGLIPTAAVKSFWDDSWNSSQGIGLYKATPNGAEGLMTRGGQNNTLTVAGLFYTGFQYSSTSSSASRGFRCAMSGLPPNTPRSFVATASSSTSVSLSWAQNGSTTQGYLLVRGAVNVAPRFQPANGSSYSAGAQAATSDVILYVGTSKAYLDKTLTTGGAYHYRVYAYDSSMNYSQSTLASVYVSPCDENWVFVAGDSDYKTQDFCVMKYEAKKLYESMPSSQAASLPWVSETQRSFLSRCSALGHGYDMMSNDEWMTLASNAAAQGYNWSSGTVGTGSMFQGHSDSSPSAICAASTDGSLAFVESTCTNIGAGGGENDETTQRRTMRLASQEIIWDLSGNVREWVQYANKSDKPYLSTDSAPLNSSLEFNVLNSALTTTPLRALIPTHAFKSFWIDAWNSSNGVGTYRAGSNGGSSGVANRGGSYDLGSESGLFAMNLVQNEGTSSALAGVRCIKRLPDTDSTSLTLVPSSGSIAVSWTSTGASSYVLVRGPAGAEPNFVPEEGSSYGVSTQGSDSILYAGSSTSVTDSSLSNGSTYFYALYAADASLHYSLLTRGTETPVACPTNYVLVPGDPDFGTDDFCVMKYEAKNDGSSNAITGDSSLPWVSITQQLALTKCTVIGNGYQLIGNNEWMTIASNLASRDSNWSGNSVGSGQLYRGHSDNDPASLCAASATDSNAFVESTCTALAAGGGENDETTQRRTHTLSTGAVLWDMAGNAMEWTNYVNRTYKPTPATAAYYEFTALASSEVQPLNQIFPTQALKSYWNNSWDSSYSVGMFYTGADSTAGSLGRGGSWATTTNAGLFAGSLELSQTTANAAYGFRCVKRR